MIGHAGLLPDHYLQQHDSTAHSRVQLSTLLRLDDEQVGYVLLQFLFWKIIGMLVGSLELLLVVSGGDEASVTLC